MARTIRTYPGMGAPCDTCGRPLNGTVTVVRDDDGTESHLGPKCAQRATGSRPASGPSTTSTRENDMAERRTAAEIATDEAEHAARMFAKATTRETKAREELEKASSQLADTRAVLGYKLQHPLIPEDVRQRLQPADTDQTALDVDSETAEDSTAV